MFSNGLIAFFVALGVGGWAYYKFSDRTGSGNNGPAIIGALASGILIFIVALITLSLIIHK